MAGKRFSRGSAPLRLCIALTSLTAAALGQAAAPSQAQAPPGTWSEGGPLSAAAGSHTSTRLFGGKVLMAGGASGDSRLADAALFNPETGTWAPTGSLTTARSLHTASLISDRPPACAANCQKVLVAGGSGADGEPLASAELFNSGTGGWEPTGPLATARSSHTATLLSTGRILVVGGSGNGGLPLASAELYNPATGRWTPTGPLGTARSLHTATILRDGRVLVAGGTGADGAPLSSAELYNPATGTWTSTGSLNDARSAHTATPLGDEISGSSDPRVLVTGGTGADGAPLASAELYDPDTGSWTRTGSLSTARVGHSATVLQDGRVLAAGGTGAGEARLASSELFDPSTGSWSATGALHTARSSHTATMLLTGKVLVAGGLGPTGAPLPTAELYEPPLGERWTGVQPLAEARSAHTATLLPNGEVLVAGGQTSFDTFRSFGPNCCNVVPLASAEVFRAASGTWAQTGRLGRARSFHTATLLTGSSAECGQNCGKVLVVGGFGAIEQPALTGNAESLASAELYDPATRSWSPAGSMTDRRAWHTATLLPNGKVLVAGGSKSPVAGEAIDSAELYDPVTDTWAPTGSLTVGGLPNRSGPQGARQNHVAVLLTGPSCGRNCGKVLVAGGTGGFGSGASFRTAELYDPATGTFQRTGDLGRSRQVMPDATLLPNGRVLVAGGFDAPLSDAPPHLDTGELYNPEIEQWESAGFLRNRRLYHRQTLLPSGDVLTTGGLAGGNAPGFPYKPGPGLLSTELFDPSQNRWRTTNFMNAGRLLHTATLLPSGPSSLCGDNCGKVLVAGGDRELIGNFIPYAAYDNPLRSAELYPPSAAATPTPQPPTAEPQPAAPFAGCPALTANVIRGTAAANTITGTVRADRIFAGTGNDVVDALAGNDCVDLGPGADRGQGGLGDDLLVAGLGADRISGSSGNDRLRGNSGNDRLDAGRGNDRAFGDAGNDLIRGSFGDDRLHGVAGNDRLFGSRGRDRISGGSGRDSISAGSSNDRVAGDAGNDRINGNSGSDSLSGNSGRDRITGLTGRDRISGGSGNDRLDARDGQRDRVNCGPGRDRVIADRIDRIARNCERVRRLR